MKTPPSLDPDRLGRGATRAANLVGPWTSSLDSDSLSGLGELDAGLSRRLLRGAAVRLGLLPIQRFLRGLERRGFRLADARALEVYGYTGERVAVHYAKRVKSLEIWEIDSSHERALRLNLPTADVRIVDSHEEIRRAASQYDLIVVDNAVWHGEHFELFPAVLDRLSDDAVLALFVITGANAATRRVYPEILSDEHVQNRRRFYETEHPCEIPLDDLIAHYERRCSAAGLRVDWTYSIRRWVVVHGMPRPTTTYLLALKVSRPSSRV
jgi:hypothetical protein